MIEDHEPSNMTIDPLHIREKEIRFALLGTLFGLIPTVIVTLRANSIVLYADMIRCLVEHLAIVFTWVIAKVTISARSTQFQYGFAKLERLASAGVAVVMAISIVVISVAALYRVLHPVSAQNTGMGLLVAALGLGANSYLLFRTKRVAMKEKSALMTSQSSLFAAKTVASGAVIPALGFGMFTSDPTLTSFIDAGGAFFVAGYLSIALINIVRDTVPEMLDCAIEEHNQLLIMKILVQNEHLYHNFCKLRTRKIGKDHHAEITIAFSGELTVREMTKRINTILSSLKEALPSIRCIIIGQDDCD